MKFIFLILALPLLNQQCKKDKSGKSLDNVPPCIQEKIDSIRSQPVWNPPAEVNEYDYEGKKVYLFSSPCCDQYNQLLDSDCNYICAPTGGYTGKGDQKCNEFFEDARHLRLVWKDER
ncbi:MAG TPA: hypothetical protein PK951_03495 [Chitinophagaceae bacterium]|nr:hypothetical protein [Chitinophagaceae bacterium]